MALILSPQKRFYTQFSADQVLEIALSLDAHRDIPIEYSYFGEGARIWDTYAKRLFKDITPNAINTTDYLLRDNLAYINFLLSQYDKINVVDVTVGNGLPIKNFITHIFHAGKLNSYTAIDKSPDILHLIRHNFEEWFEGRLKIDTNLKDINHERFAEITNRKLKDLGRTVNVVLYLGGTSHNFRDMRDSFRVIQESMHPEDILVHTVKLDSSNSRSYFDFNPEPSDKKLPVRHSLMLDLMDVTSLNLISINEELYEVERDYDEDLKQRYIRIRLLEDIIIRFNTKNGVYDVAICKGETIQLLRMWHQNYLEVLGLLDSAGLKTLHFSHTDDEEYLLTVSRIKRD